MAQPTPTYALLQLVLPLADFIGNNPLSNQNWGTSLGDGNEVFIDLQKNDDSYGIPHGTLNKKQTSNQQDSPHLPEFSNKTNLSIRIDVYPMFPHPPP